ncbi:MAG: helix-turn-helix transcriptional regulator [Deltaproteobacteria bacterium]|nr:helix-turn-helix transcriptional regulator [Deltaproteobacteria bacterium]
MKYHILFPIKKLRELKRLSERALAEAADLSRGCIRNIKAGTGNSTVESLSAAAQALGKEVEIIVSDPISISDFSTVATAYKVERDGFESWKIHFMDLVDAFNRTLDVRLVIMPPPKSFDKKLAALMASLVRYLCEQVEISAPKWSVKRYYLPNPWFVSGVESLKASAILESPTPFRNNNIFVLNNFAARA